MDPHPFVDHQGCTAEAPYIKRLPTPCSTNYMESPPANLSQHDRNVIFDNLDLNFNRTLLESLLQGLYTFIVAVTLWTTLSSPKKSGNAFLLTVVVILYLLTTIAFGVDWTYQRRAFIQNGDNFFSVFVALQSYWAVVENVPTRGRYWRGNVHVIVDITIIWRCWVFWGRRWCIIIVPALCAVAGTVAKSMQIRSVFINTTNNIGETGGFAAEINWPLIYISLTLATTLLCTLLIVYRIVRLAFGVSSYGKIVEIVIESSAIYSLALIVYLALVARNLESSYYADIIMAYVKVIAPTLLVGRVAAGSNSNSNSQTVVHSTRDRSSVLSRFLARKRETIIIGQNVEDSTTSLGSYRKSIVESV
ncbi:uncharacterized protein EV420DRAFT_1673457 [Desarmillaria tabescens]|uniref:Uncharacterized protein n=1 Tax=Armillaria tabescens TaxID=1929756 RepID=A0AA39N709_ARMTA|nr:uncharacterized protein EV420DRAFT_1673457 [Desarmillaria tabescens]KAK0460262.1 hypothetical protein EV420DRAFT_1673457 [Desarmillaria tabescens]